MSPITNSEIHASLERYLLVGHNNGKKVIKVTPKKAKQEPDARELLEYLDLLFDIASKAKSTRQIECAYFALRGALLGRNITS